MPKIVTVFTGPSSPPPHPHLPPHPNPLGHHPHPSREEALPQPSRTIGPQSEYCRPVTMEQNTWGGRPTTGSTDCAPPSANRVRGWSDTASPSLDPTSGSGVTPPHDRSVVPTL